MIAQKDGCRSIVSSAWILAGATATGKSAVCQLLAERLGLRILSADSMLVYRGMDIGTAKPVVRERGSVAYGGIDLVTPDQPFSTGAWIQSVRDFLAESAAEGSAVEPVIVTGGTGLYLRALISGMDAEAVCPERRRFWQSFLAEHGLAAVQSELRKRIGEADARLADSVNPRRIIRALEHLEISGRLPDSWRTEEQRPPVVALRMPRAQLHVRISQRVKQMFAGGLLDEVRELRQLYPQWSATADQAIGYQEALAVLTGRLTQEEAMERITIRTRQLAKRQETWFRHQQNTVWCEIEASDCVEAIAEKVLNLWTAYGKIALKI